MIVMKNLNFKIILTAIILMAGLLHNKSTNAAVCCGPLAYCEAELLTAMTCLGEIPTLHVQQMQNTTARVFQEAQGLQMWLTIDLWRGNILPALQEMAKQFSSASQQQALAIGSFFDAKHQMETQRVLQTIRARAHKDYHPSSGMCEFGTSVRSLAASERKSELNSHVMSQRSQDRQLGNTNTAAAGGALTDINARIEQFKTTYCDPYDNNSALAGFCVHDDGVGATAKKRVNKDIDFARTIEFPMTMNIDLTDQNVTHEEEDVLAMASNLYGHDVFDRPDPSCFIDLSKVAAPYDPSKVKNCSEDSHEAAREAYLNARSLVAKRSVAENSFNAITAMKSAGTAGSREFLSGILQELGMNTDGEPSAVLRTLGLDYSHAEIGPSYYTQMDILTKKIYQNPDFYTNLYDKPANIERKEVAMQAIGLMQKFDLLKSALRAEANTAILLELTVEEYQARVENELVK